MARREVKEVRRPEAQVVVRVGKSFSAKAVYICLCSACAIFPVFHKASLGLGLVMAHL